MPNIVHRIGTFKASNQQLYNAVATVSGLQNWWTKDIKGDAKEGGILKFRFAKGGPDFEVLDMQPFEHVEWRCLNGPEEWIDTHIEFDISEDENGETLLLFKHSGWREENEFMHHCSTQWAYFLIGLKKFVEDGEGTPYGVRMEPISSWSK